MFRIIEVNGEKMELTANSATGLVYKQVFKSELQSDLTGVNVKQLKKLQGTKAEDLTAEDQKRILDLMETVIKLAFIMQIQCRAFKDYWAKVSFDDYVEWRATQDSGKLMSAELLAGVLVLYKDEQQSTSIPKN